MPVFPVTERSCDDTFLRTIDRSNKKWVVLVDRAGSPRLVLNADGYLRNALLSLRPLDPVRHCHRPIVFNDKLSRLGEAIPRLAVRPAHLEDDVIDEDIILFWGSEKRIITGSDILGRLLRGIASNRRMPPGQNRNP